MKNHKIIDYEQLANYNVKKNIEIDNRLSPYIFTDEKNTSFDDSIPIQVDADTLGGHDINYFATKDDINKLDNKYIKKDELDIKDLNIDTPTDEEINDSIDDILGGE